MKKYFVLLSSISLLSFVFFCKDHSIQLDKAPVGGNFTLQSQKGSFSLTDLKGQVVILYFGFLSCPDVCPTTLTIFSSAMKELPKEQSSKVNFLFIDVDPERDGFERLLQYTQFFHSQIIPLTGSILELENVAKLYGASFQKIQIQSSLGYTIDHTTNLFIIDQRGIWIKTIPHGFNKGEIKKTIKELLENERLK